MGAVGLAEAVEVPEGSFKVRDAERMIEGSLAVWAGDEDGWVVNVRQDQRENEQMVLGEIQEFVGQEGLQVQGRIKKVLPKRSGDSSYNPGEEWTSQIVILADDSGEAMLQLKDRKEDLGQSAVGKILRAESVMQERLGKKTGVAVREYDDDDGKHAKIVVTKSAILTIEGGTVLEAGSTGRKAEPRYEPVDPSKAAETAKAMMADLLAWASLQKAREDLQVLSLTSEDYRSIVISMFIKLSGGR